MLKNVLIVLVVIAGIWYYMVGGRKLDEAGVRAYYDKELRANIARDADAVCKLMSQDVLVEMDVEVAGQRESGTRDHDEACEGVREGMGRMDTAEKAAGQHIAVEFDNDIGRIEVAGNRRLATVEGVKTARIAGFLVITSTYRDELVSELGQVRLQHSKMQVRVRPTGRGAMSQSDFFKK